MGGGINILANGFELLVVSGVGVGCASFRMAVGGQSGFLLVLFLINVQATDRFGAGSVYFVRFGAGDEGRLGTSCVGC